MASTKGYVRITAEDGVYVYVAPGNDGQAELAKKRARLARKAAKEQKAGPAWTEGANPTTVDPAALPVT